MRVGLDLDGVCFDFSASLSRYLDDYFPAHDYKIETPKRWDFYLDWGMTQEEFINHCNNGVDKGIVFSWGLPLDMAASAVSFMRSLGNTVHIITDRSFGSVPMMSYNATKDWLAMHDIEYDSLNFSSDKTCVKTDVFIEDKPENYDALVNAGVDCYLVDRPWNQEKDSRKRIKSIQEFASIVGQLTI